MCFTGCWNVERSHRGCHCVLPAVRQTLQVMWRDELGVFLSLKKLVAVVPLGWWISLRESNVSFKMASLLKAVTVILNPLFLSWGCVHSCPGCVQRNSGSLSVSRGNPVPQSALQRHTWGIIISCYSAGLDIKIRVMYVTTVLWSLDDVYLCFNAAVLMHVWFLVEVGLKCQHLWLTCSTDSEAANRWPQWFRPSDPRWSLGSAAIWNLIYRSQCLPEARFPSSLLNSELQGVFCQFGTVKLLNDDTRDAFLWTENGFVWLHAHKFLTWCFCAFPDILSVFMLDSMQQYFIQPELTTWQL